MNSPGKENSQFNNESFSKTNINISIYNNSNSFINNINNIDDLCEEKKTNDFYITNNKKDKSTQTEPNALYFEEEDIPIIINELKNKQRKNSPDLIRDKIFKFFNKKLFHWILESKTDNDKIDIISYQFEKNNKQCILKAMNKYLKELFISKNQIEEVQNIKNELLKYKLEFKYEDIYKIFICDRKEVKPEKYLEHFLDKFEFLGDFLKSLEVKETKEYINKTKDIALNYEKWKNKKMHFSGQYD